LVFTGSRLFEVTCGILGEGVTGTGLHFEFYKGWLCFAIIFSSNITCWHNHTSALEQSSFVTEAVLDLLARNCMMKSPLSVVDGPSKKRLVINLKYLNSLLGWVLILTCSRGLY